VRLAADVVQCFMRSCAVGAGFYGNEETHKGLQRFLDAAYDITETTNRTNLQVGSEWTGRQ